MSPIYVALLRGINVGGKNMIKMSDLTALFQAQGFSDVQTYIQSGNVIFSAAEPDQARLPELLEEALSAAFHYQSRLVVRSLAQMEDTVAQAPQGFGSTPDDYRYDVMFLKEPASASEAIVGWPLKEGVDRIYAGNGVLYSARLVSRLTQSRIGRIAAMPIYQSITIRNWNTTTKLLQMMKEVKTS